MRKSFSFVSLFSGCGGFDIGASAAGGTCIFAADISEACVSTYNHYFGHVAEVHDLGEGVPKALARKKCDLVLAGPPCQGFSVLGPHSPEDSRNQLLVAAAELSLSLRPKAIIIENVLGILSERVVQSVRNAEEVMRESGYSIDRVVTSAFDSGLPQHRKRVFIVARRGKVGALPDLQRLPQKSLRQLLRGVSRLPNHEPRPLGSGTLAEKMAAVLKPGEQLSNARTGGASRHSWTFPSVFGPVSVAERELLETMLRQRRVARVREIGDADPLSAHQLSRALGRSVRNDLQRLLDAGYVRRRGKGFDLTHTFNGKFRRPDLNGTVPAVDTRFGDPSYALHPTEDRGFTVREAARIQGFPDDFTFLGRLREQFRMVGNAVPPPAATRVVRAVVASMT